MEKLSAGREANLYALIAWNYDMSPDEALKDASTKNYEELLVSSGAKPSIDLAIAGLQRHFGIPEGITHECSFSRHKIEGNEADCDKIVEILAEIHDAWVANEENAVKYERKGRLYQHTPTALIGIEELSKDLMFLAPFLEEMGFNAGVINAGERKFEPSEAVVKAYERYVEKYMEKNGILSENDLSEHIKECVNGAYEPLQGDSEVAEKRRDYIKNNIEELVETIKSKNPKQLGKLPSQSQQG